MGLLFGAGQITDEEKSIIEEAVKTNPWAFIDALANSDDRPLADLMDWILARDGERQPPRPEAS